MKVKTYVIEVPTERFIFKVRGIDIIVSDINDLEQLIEKYGEKETTAIGHYESDESPQQPDPDRTEGGP